MGSILITKYSKIIKYVFQIHVIFISLKKKSNVIRISSVRPVPWLVVNHLHLLLDGRYDADMSVKLTLESVKVNELIKWLI